MMSPRLFIVVYALALFWAGYFAGAGRERLASANAMLALQAERIAREGMTDREFYARHPDQLAGGVSQHERRR